MAAPRTDAELLAAHVLGISRGRLLLADAFTVAQADSFVALVARREHREPLQHLIGSVAFADIELAVGAGAFVPRPETELLVAWALTRRLPAEPVVLDLCGGTGAIALAVAHAMPAARVTTVECDPAALAWLRRNATDRVSAGDRQIEIIDGDVTVASTTAPLDGVVSLLLCNPPYVPDGTAVPLEVSAHDPAAAVFGGRDGLSVIRPVIARAVALLRPGGWVGIEHDDSHGRALVDLFEATGAFTEIRMHVDLAERPRFTVAQRR